MPVAILPAGRQQEVRKLLVALIYSLEPVRDTQHGAPIMQIAGWQAGLGNGNGNGLRMRLHRDAGARLLISPFAHLHNDDALHRRCHCTFQFGFKLTLKLKFNVRDEFYIMGPLTPALTCLMSL